MSSVATESRHRAAAFLRDWSLEATLPKAVEIEGLKGNFAPDAQIYLSAIPAQPVSRIIEAAAFVRRAGFEPVPHIAARNYPDRAALADVLAQMQRDAAITRVLVIGGDRDSSAGPYNDALSIIESGLLQASGVREIGIGGYPEGHPHIPADRLERAFADKLAAAQRAGLEVHAVTQFSFDVAAVLAWLRKLRAAGFGGLVRVGIAGPASMTTLLKYAQRCGVRASARGLARSAGLALQALGRATPDDLVSELAEGLAGESLGEVKAHLYSFGGVATTAQWARGAEVAG
jgi:methylenetetrahydrofolate reductase (NADPH)